MITPAGAPRRTLPVLVRADEDATEAATLPVAQRR